MEGRMEGRKGGRRQKPLMLGYTDYFSECIAGKNIHPSALTYSERYSGLCSSHHFKIFSFLGHMRHGGRRAASPPLPDSPTIAEALGSAGS